MKATRQRGRRHERQYRACGEGHGCAPPPVKQAERDAGRKRRQSDGHLIGAQRTATPFVRDHVDDLRLLRTLGEAVVRAVDRDQRPELPGAAASGEARVMKASDEFRA